MSTWGHYSMSDRESPWGRHSSWNGEFTSDRNDIVSHASFIHLDTESAVDTIALDKQRVPIKTMGLPEGNIYLRIPCMQMINEHEQNSTHQQQPQCYLKLDTYTPFISFRQVENDDAAMAKDVHPVESPEIAHSDILAICCVAQGPKCSRAVLNKVHRIEEVEGSFKLVARGACRRVMILPMQPYQTRKERFAIKIYEASVDLRRAQSALARVARRVCRALSTPQSWQTAFFSPILLATGAGALTPEQPTKIQISTLSYDYWFKVLHDVRTNIPSLLVGPHIKDKDFSQTPLTSDPRTLLLACFICTGSLALITQARRKDMYQPYIIALCALIATIIGAMRTADCRVFIFGYLFWGCAIGAGGSAIMHMTKNQSVKEVAE